MPKPSSAFAQTAVFNTVNNCYMDKTQAPFYMINWQNSCEKRQHTNADFETIVSEISKIPVLD